MATMTAKLMATYSHMAALSLASASSLSTQWDSSRFCPNCSPLYDTWRMRYGTWQACGEQGVRVLSGRGSGM